MCRPAIAFIASMITRQLIRVLHRSCPLLTAGLVALSIGAASAQSDEKSQTELTRETVASWVADLGSDSRAVRVRAEEALTKHGPAVVDLLPSNSTLDPTVRESLERIVRTIEDSQTRSALVPRRVLIRSGDPTECLNAIETQTGNAISRPGISLPMMQVFPPDEPLTFWEAIDWIEMHSDLRYGGHQIQVLLQPRPPATESGPFRIQLLDHSLRRTAAGQKLLSAKLRVECEPRLRPLFLVAGVDKWTARIGDQGLEAFTPGASRELPAGRTGEIDIAYDFLVPTASEGKLSLTGEVSLTLSARTTSVTFSDLQARLPQVRRRGQASLSLLSIKTGEEETVIRMALAFPESRGLFESYRSSLLTPDLSLELADGKHLSALETAQVQEDPDGNILESSFATADRQPVRLRALIPASISTQTVRFEFKDVSLADSP